MNRIPKADKAYANRVIVIDEDWQIRRLDRLNWIIVHKGEWFEKGYHGTLCSALSALPAIMLQEQAKNDVGEVLRLIRGITEEIRNAIPY